MALVKGTNTYVTVDEADTYFETRLDVAAWVNADVAQKEAALVTATSLLDEKPWNGYTPTVTQKLAFPRIFR